MLQTRRSLARAFLLGSATATLGAALRPGTAGAQTLSALTAPTLPPPVVAQPSPVADLRARLRQARAALPASDTRGRLAADRTLARMDDLGIEGVTGRLIVVNLPAAELIAYDNGREVMRSRVVVGASKTRTPQMTTFVTGARLNPPWYVPASIAPEIRAAGAVGFQVVNGRYIQPPGPTNPLGPIRIGLLDSDGIFLHGTSNPATFSRADRAVSHGCVRVERIRDLAAWLLDQSPATVGAALATGRTLEFTPAQEVQVVLAYLTAWPDARGRLVTYGDPYGFDVAGARRAPYRRVSRPVIQTPEEAETEARGTMTEDNPL